MRTRAQLSAALGLAVVLVVSGHAEAKGHFQFLGAHPIAAKYGGGYCYIEAPHLHAYPPDHPALYQQVGEQQVFTGDPTPFGYEGEKHRFYGHHPVMNAEGQVVYCYIDGPHFHPFEAVGPEYNIRGDVAFYVGPFDPAYGRLRVSRAPLINAEYRPYASFRPVVEVQPPPEWHGEVYVAPPAVRVGVQGPGAEVEMRGPPGRVDVEVPAVHFGIGIHGQRISIPGPVDSEERDRGRIGERREHDSDRDHDRGWDHDREHHDNGKHSGGGKHDRH